jgi:hypothetical protein
LLADAGWGRLIASASQTLRGGNFKAERLSK